MGSGFDQLCRIMGAILLHLAFGSAIVAIATTWIDGFVKTDIKIAEADEHMYISLWRREVQRDPGSNNAELWHDYINRQGKHEEYCPEKKGTTYGDVFKRVQAAEACACLAVIFGLVTCVAAIVHTCGFTPSRLTFTIPAAFLIASAIGTIISWMNFYNLCDDNFCSRYVNQLKATEGQCGLSVGFGFECAVIGLTVLGLIPLWAVGGRTTKYEVISR